MMTTTKELIKGIFMDLFPSFATQMDFGIQPSENPTAVFGALQTGLKREYFTDQELNSALGNGPALTELVHRGRNPYGNNLTITTTWDDMLEEDIEERETNRSHATTDQQEK